MSPIGSMLTGLFAGVILVIAVQLFDKVFRIDDPVGAISVHGVCGAFGTLAVGFFALDGGLVYGGGASLLIAQMAGIGATFLWCVAVGFILATVIKLQLESGFRSMRN